MVGVPAHRLKKNPPMTTAATATTATTFCPGLKAETVSRRRPADAPRLLRLTTAFA